MPNYQHVLVYVKKAYAAQQETLHLVESQMGQWQKLVAGSLESQRAGRRWAETMLQLIKELTMLSEELGSMRRFLRALGAKDIRNRPKDGPG